MARGGDPLAELVARLRDVGLDPDVPQLCDALWLARWTRPVEAADQEDPPAGTGAGPRPGPTADVARTGTGGRAGTAPNDRSRRPRTWGPTGG